MKRISTMAIAVFAAMALVGPTAAHAGGAHLLGLYKVEKHIDLEGEDLEYTVKCKTGDIAIDGMWRIDNVDQDNDYLYEPLHGSPDWYDVLLSVEPVAAYADATDVDMWHFEFINQAGGDAQGKLFLTCLPLKATPLGGHSVKWDPSAIKTDAGTTVDFSAGTWPGSLESEPDTSSAPCDSGEIAIQPGFEWTTGYGKVYKRVPDSYRYPKYWNWGFTTSSLDVNKVVLSWRCLPLTSKWSNDPATTGHRHRISTSKKYKVTPPSLAADLTDEAQAICGEHYKAMLGGWDFTGYHNKLWYMGMDPRPKARAFKVLNTDPGPAGISTTGKFGAVCFKDKTT